MLKLSGFTWNENLKMLQCEKQQYDTHCKTNIDARGLYGVSFPRYETLSAIYGSDIATGESVEGLTDAVTNMEQEIAAYGNNEGEEDERASKETPRRSIDSTSSSSKKRKKEGKCKEGVSSDPLLDMFIEVSGELKVVGKTVEKMGEAMMREAAIQEKAMNEDPQQKMRERAVNELRRLEFTGGELIKAASVFVNMPDQMGMMFALPEPLRREYIVDMLRDEAKRKERDERLGGGSRYNDM